MKEVVTQDALEIASKNYSEYGKYVANGRAYPNVKDGCKSAYKRAIYGMYKDGPRSMVKVAKLASYALPYHPHPSSISGVVVSLGNRGNKLSLMDTQGMWGDSSKGIPAAADRYIEGKLSDLAIKLLCDSVEYARTIKGEIDEDEPVALPALLPLCFINGYNGIPSGLPTLGIPTLNIDDMIKYYMEVLKHKSLDYRPKWVPNPNLEVDIVSTKKEWEQVLKTGKGSIKLAPIMTIENGVITITSIPGAKNVETVRAIVSKEIELDKIDVRDESTSDIRIVIEKVPKKWCDMNEIYNRLYKRLQIKTAYSMAFFDEEEIYVPCSFDKVVKSNLEFLIETHQNRIQKQIDSLKEKLVVLFIIEQIKKNKDVVKLATMNHDQAVEFISDKYECVPQIAIKVLQKPISYLTKEHEQELKDLDASIQSLENDKSDIYDFLLRKYTELRKYIAPYIKNKFLPSEFKK